MYNVYTIWIYAFWGLLCILFSENVRKFRPVQFSEPLPSQMGNVLAKSYSSKYTSPRLMFRASHNAPGSKPALQMSGYAFFDDIGIHPKRKALMKF